ncbi:Crp/Fnr family transcriptional regulator [Chitinophaga sp. CF418]|uniref:Crp/Fnr family transcriptional regulator n=1 Tax=Chitinophaga sp. CF418 TaxID=1855287 RepID=UPI000923CC65|nr:Crp/Fnr family transcriptional regulator [Chitinophaga sp. CF418]SHL94195.1 cAMP-binding domain of CRP or a regulatory subunit of cAMP-dependent protein kinases [Chitinophaga sp. CF418]
MQGSNLYIASNQLYTAYDATPDSVDPRLEIPCLPGHGYHTFFQALKTCTGLRLTDIEKQQLMDGLQYRRLRRRQYFLQEGDVCRHLGFILRGAARMYAVNAKGQETILCFDTEKSWLGDRESFHTGRPSGYHIEALEQMEILSGSRQQIGALCAAIPAFRAFLEHDHHCQLSRSQLRLHTALGMSAEERYLDLLTNWPAYVKRFSQNMIACYLGIKPETLSRIRKSWQGR